MQSDRWLEVQLFDRFRNRVGSANDYVSCTVTDGWLKAGTGELVVKADHPYMSDMLAPGARARVLVNDGFGGQYSLGGETVLTGRLIAPRGGFLAKDNVTFTIKDDWSILTNTVARVIPAGDIQPTSFADLAQTRWDGVTTLTPGTITGLLGRYAWPSGAIDASTAVLQLINENLVARWEARFGPMFHVEADPHIGGDVSSILPSVRFDTLENYIVPLLQAGGIGLKVWQNELTTPYLDIDFIEPTTWPAKLTPDSGLVTGGTWSLGDIGATDVTVGGPGEEAARAFRQFQDIDAAAAIQQLIEVFRDDTGAPYPWPDGLDDSVKLAVYYHLRPEVLPDNLTTFEADLASAAVAALRDGAPKSGMTVTLAENEIFRWGGFDGYHSGDIVTVAPSAESRLGDAATFTDHITQTTFAQTKDSGLAVTPQVGERQDDPSTQLAQAIVALARANTRRSTNQ